MFSGIILISWLCFLPGTCGQIWMDMTPIKQLVKAGGSTTLACTVENLGNSHVMWFGPRNDLLFRGEDPIISDVRFSLKRPYSNSWYLVIKNVKIGDSGVYKCQVRYPTTLTKNITLQVQVAPRILPSSSSEDQHVQEGSEVNITCEATGFPEPKIMWHFVKGNTETQLDTGPHLSISNISREESGIYRCTAYNTVTPSATQDFKVDVEYAPIIIVKTPELSQKSGRSAVLECSVVGFPKPKYNWKKDNKILVRDWNYEPQNIQQNSTTTVMNLLIKQAEPPSGFGVYYCVAENKYGEAIGNVTLHEITTTTTTTTVSPTTTSTTTESTTTLSTVPSTQISTSSLPSTSTQKSQTSPSQTQSPTTSKSSTVSPRTTSSYRPLVTSGPGYEINLPGDQGNSSAGVTFPSRTIFILVLTIFLTF
ncbi:protein amalgam-like [Saccostrea echinata]|uniref:protein amalgam-like n=1 Tax=Saccostrea echinata TaxID=191078 RepID=UPI002A83B13B|nr:protein amalgam-like [Saccostrea echinata]